LARLAGICAGGDVAGGFDEIQQMMRNAGALGGVGLGGTNLEFPIHGNGITIHDFAGKMFCDGEGERRFTARGGPQHDYQQGLRLRGRQRQCALQLILCQYRMTVRMRSITAISSRPVASNA